RTIHCPCFLTPYLHDASTVLAVELEIVLSSYFYLAGYQCQLWVAGSVIYSGLWDPRDPKETEVARHMSFKAGDTLPFLIRGSSGMCGVAVLHEAVGNGRFDASLHFPSKSVPVAKGTPLLSAASCEMERIVGRFESASRT